jgi:hypothetical protein
VLSTDGGETSVATENVGERDGWFHLNARQVLKRLKAQRMERAVQKFSTAFSSIL